MERNYVHIGRKLPLTGMETGERGWKAAEQRMRRKRKKDKSKRWGSWEEVKGRVFDLSLLRIGALICGD